MPPLKHSFTPPVFGVLVMDVESSYQVPLFHELCRQSESLGVKLVAYTGTSFNQTFWFDRQMNIAYHLANKKHLDGLLSITSTFMRAGTESAVARLIQSFKPIPTVSLTAAIPDVPSVLIDNESGFRVLLEHLIKDHGYRDFAFLTGPAGSQDAQQRLKTFRTVMSENDIHVDPRLIQDGEFYYFPARHAADKIFATGLPVQVIVTANDEMAMAAMGVAAERGIRVPEEVAIVGIDDLHPHVSGLRLTTVNNSLNQQVEAALTSLLDQLAGKEVAESTRIPSRMVLRQSCGCETAPLRDTPPAFGSEEAQENLLSSLMLDEVKTPVFRRFLQDALQALHDKDQPRLERLVWEMARFCQGQNEVDFSKPQDLIFGIQNILLSPAEQSPEDLWRQGTMLNKAQVMLTQARMAFSVYVGERSGLSGGSLNILKRELMSFEIHQQMENLPELLQEIGIKTCIIAFYNEQGYFNTNNDFFLPSEARLVACIVNGTRHNNQLWRPFATEDLLPESVWQLTGNTPLIVSPIFQQVGHYGYILFGPEQPIGLTRESVRDAIASALIGAQLVDEIGRIRDSLNNEVVPIATRTGQTLEQTDRHDNLSGLLNRRGFLERVADRIGHPPQTCHLLVQARIQALEIIEQEYGASEKNFLVQQTAILFAGVLRTSDLAARLQEDHFIALCSEVKDDFSKELGSRLYAAVEQFNLNSGKPYRLDCELHMQFVPENLTYETLEQLIASFQTP